MSDEVAALLKVHEYFQGVSDETLQEVMRAPALSSRNGGSQADVVLTTVGFCPAGGSSRAG